MQFLYNGPDIAAEYLSAWIGANAVYAQGPGADAALLRAVGVTAESTYYHRDGLNSVVAATTSGGTVSGFARYDAWGNRTASSGSIPQYGYTGREPDETGLIYYRARYYDPSIGRFTQRDPAGFIDGINRYAYAANNPITNIDPTGRSIAPPTYQPSSSYYLSNSVLGGGVADLGGMSVEAQRSAYQPEYAAPTYRDAALDRAANMISVTATGSAAFGLGGALDLTYDRTTLSDGTVESRPGIDVGYGARTTVMADFRVLGTDEALSGPLHTNLTLAGGVGFAGGVNFAADYNGNWELTISGGLGYGLYYGSVSPISMSLRGSLMPPTRPEDPLVHLLLP